MRWYYINSKRLLTIVFVLMILSGRFGLAGEEQEAKLLCGPLCLAFCAKWLGVQVHLDDVVARTMESGKRGTSLLALMNAAQELGLEARAYRFRLRDLRKLSADTPGIAHVDGDHFVVVWTRSDGDVTVVDSGRAVSHVSPRSFGQRWDGNILIVSRRDGQPQWPVVSEWGSLAIAIIAVLAPGAGFLLLRGRTRVP